MLTRSWESILSPAGPARGSIWVFPKIVGFPPKSSILIRFSIIFTIHFGGFSPYFWKHPYTLFSPGSVSEAFQAEVSLICCLEIWRISNPPKTNLWWFPRWFFEASHGRKDDDFSPHKNTHSNLQILSSSSGCCFEPLGALLEMCSELSTSQKTIHATTWLGDGVRSHQTFVLPGWHRYYNTQKTNMEPVNEVMEEGSPSFPEASLQTLTSSWCSLLRESFQFFSSLNWHIEHFLKNNTKLACAVFTHGKNRHALSITKNEVSSFHMARSARSALKTQKKTILIITVRVGVFFLSTLSATNDYITL